MWGKFVPWLAVCASGAALWSTGCAGSARPSRLLVDANPVRVEIEGRGTVRSADLGIECRGGNDGCKGENFRVAWSELNAEPDPGWRFVRWDSERGTDNPAACQHTYRAVFEPVARTRTAKLER